MMIRFSLFFTLVCAVLTHAAEAPNFPMASPMASLMTSSEERIETEATRAHPSAKVSDPALDKIHACMRMLSQESVKEGVEVGVVTSRINFLELRGMVAKTLFTQYWGHRKDNSNEITCTTKQTESGKVDTCMIRMGHACYRTTEKNQDFFSCRLSMGPEKENDLILQIPPEF